MKRVNEWVMEVICVGGQQSVHGDKRLLLPSTPKCGSTLVSHLPLGSSQPK